MLLAKTPCTQRLSGVVLQEHSWWYGTGVGLASIAISGIDIALWDLKGKMLGVSVLDLLGGPVHDQLPAIASLHGTKVTIEEMAEEIAAHTATGLHGAKVGFGKTRGSQPWV